MKSQKRQNKKTMFHASFNLLVGLGFLLVPLACGDDNGGGSGDTTKAAWVYIGTPGDFGWTFAHHQGLLDVKASLDNVETSYVENVDDSDKEKTVQEIEKLVSDGNQIIFTTSYGYMNPTLEVAGKYPDVNFEHCSGYKTSGNMSNYFGRIYQSRYLTGIVAGHMTTEKKIGYVAAFPIPEVIRGINAFTLGVHSVAVDAEVHVKWTNTWYDPVVEKNTAIELLDLGCDVIAQHQDTMEPVKAAKERGKYAIGYNSDMLQTDTLDTVLTSAIWNWGVYYKAQVEAVQNGTWTGDRSHWGSMADGMVGLGSFGEMVSQEIKTEVDEKKALITGGTWDVFHGPINKQDGSVWKADGEKFTDAELLGLDTMNQFVEGVVGEIPAN